MERGDAGVPCCSMATTDPALQPAASTTGRTINEFSIQVATVNGSGSASANGIFAKTLFRMGYPFSYDLGDLARYHAAYERLMEHWRGLCPGFVLDLDYEALRARLPPHVEPAYDGLGVTLVDGDGA